MEAFQWNPCFVTGLTDVDEQHHRLVDIINRFGNLVMQESGASFEEIEAVFSELADYAHYHFFEEEALMLTMRVDGRYIEQHKHTHQKFLDEVERLHAAVTVSNQAAAKSLLQFLAQWLAYHILGSDQFLAKQIAAIQAGVRPEDAYLADVPHKDPATATLLSALDGLFQQVSERNQELLVLNKTLEARVAERTLALTEANRRLDDLANTDPLTGLPNRRYALSYFAKEWELAVQGGYPISCMMVDADGFKTVNDTQGHDAGDVVLRALAKRLQHSVRTDDIVCRLGGDEFLVICTGTPLEGAKKIAEAVRSDVAKLRISAGSGEWLGSISIGVASRTEGMEKLEDLMRAADGAVYEAKRNGRNRVESTKG